jgi:NADH:ubiquinone oxidoreductase subunit 4 (subunit M)
MLFLFLVILGFIVFLTDPPHEKVGRYLNLNLGVFTLLIILFVFAEFPDSLEHQEQERQAISQMIQWRHLHRHHRHHQK